MIRGNVGGGARFPDLPGNNILQVKRTLSKMQWLRNSKRLFEQTLLPKLASEAGRE